MPEILNRVSDFLLLVLDVRFRLKEESVQHGERLDSHGLGKIRARLEALFQKILLHVRYSGHLDDLLVKSFNICSEGHIFPLDDGLYRGFQLGMSEGDREVP